MPRPSRKRIVRTVVAMQVVGANPWLLVAGALAGFVVVLIAIAFGLALVSELTSENCGGGNGTPTANVSAPSGNVQGEGQAAKYLESQGVPENAAAGMVGNFVQENNLQPTSDGGGAGIAQWNASWFSEVSNWISAHGQDPSSLGGQLEYVAAVVTSGVPGDEAPVGDSELHQQMFSASSPQDAALFWMNDYEQCSGAAGNAGTDNTNGGLCDAINRQNNATQALQAAGGSGSGGTAVDVSDQVGGGCEASPSALRSSSGKDPIPSPPWNQERDDMGVDANAPTGTPIYAPVASTLVMDFPDWFDTEPLLMFRFDQPQQGAKAGDQYWYVAEQIIPVTTQIGTNFNAGQPVATYAASGTGIEIGWASPTCGQLTLACQEGDGAAASPTPGSTTPWGESFKTYFNFPRSWIGWSP